MARSTPQPEAPQLIDTTATVADDAFSQFVAACGRSETGGRVKVYRIIDGRRVALPGAVYDARTFDDQAVAEKFGGGNYWAQTIDARGQYGKGCTFEIAGDSIDPAPVRPQQPDQGATLAAALRDALAPILQRVEHIERAAQQPNTLELVRAIAETMRPAVQANQQPAAGAITAADLLPYLLKQAQPTAGLADLMQLAEKLATKMPGSAAAQKEGDEGDGTGRVIGTILSQVVTGFQQARQQQPAAMGALPAPTVHHQAAAGTGPAVGAGQPAAPTQAQALPPIDGRQAAVIEIIRGQVRDAASGDDDAPTAAAAIVSILGDGDAAVFAAQYLNDALSEFVTEATRQYAPDLVPHLPIVRTIAQAVKARTEEATS